VQKTGGLILMVYTSYDMFFAQGVAFWGS